jgi:hypothetical protein
MAYTKGDIFVKKETTWGVGIDPTSPTSGIDEILGLDSEYEYGLENQVTAVNPAAMAYPSEISYHTAKARGKIDFVYNGALPFAVMLGGITNSDPLEEESPYTWTITPSGSPIPFTASFMMKGASDKLAQMPGCFAKSLSFKLALNEPASGTLDLIGKDLALNSPFTAPSTVAIDDAPSWKPHEFTYSIGTISGIDYITDIEFNISRSIDLGHGLAARKPSTAYSGKFEAVNGSITCYIPDSETADEIEKLVLGGTSISEALSPKDIVIDKGYADETEDTAKITLSNCIFSDYSAVFPLDTKLSYKFSFSATSASVLWEAPFAKTNW